MPDPFRPSPSQLFVTLCGAGLGIDEALAVRSWQALSQSPQHPKARAVHELFTGYTGGVVDFAGWVFYRLPPTLLVEAVESLVAPGLLDRPAVSLIQEHIFAAMDSTPGHHHEWK